VAANNMTLAESYAGFASELQWSRLRPAVSDIAVELFADWFANAAAGYGSAVTTALLGLAPGSGTAVRVGDLKATDPLAAAMINASAAHANEFDDSYRAGLFHPGAPIQAAAFAAACHVRVSGAELLTAIVAGYEISMRLAAAINPAHYKVWHTTGTVGAFGAAAACARVLRLDAAQTAGALGLAGTQAAGLWEILPATPLAKNLHPAKAAHSGLLAAFLADKGISGPASIFEGDRGFFAAMVPAQVDEARCLDGLGTQWLVLDATFKAYPVCGHAMTPIEAALELHGRAPTADLVSVQVRAHPLSLQIAGERNPANEAQAKFSIPYCVAVALMKGRVGLEEFSPQMIHDPALRDLVSRIELVADDGLAKVAGKRPARVTVRLRTGETLAAQADVRKGDPERPMSAGEKRDKCIRLAVPVWGEPAAHNMIDAISALPAASDTRKWAEELRRFIADR